MSTWLSPEDWQAYILTLQLAGISTIMLLLISPPLAWWLVRSRSVLQPGIETLVTLPIVLPPTVLGFYLLLAFSQDGWLGSMVYSLTGQGLAFTFEGLVAGSILYSLPFAVLPMQTAFRAIPETLLEVASNLRAGPADRFLHVVLPEARWGLVAAATMSFAHTLGEFGVVLMIGGNLQGETRVVSIVLYEHVEAFQIEQAHNLSLLLLLTCSALLLGLFLGQRRLTAKRQPR